MLETEYMPCFDISATEKQIHRYIDSNMPESDLNGGQGRTLGFIRMQTEKGLPTYQKDIEKELNIRKSSVTSLLQLLEKKGYIVREAVSQDARLKRLVLTPLGEELDAKARASIEGSDRRIKEALSESEVEALRNILQKIRNIMKED